MMIIPKATPYHEWECYRLGMYDSRNAKDIISGSAQMFSAGIFKDILHLAIKEYPVSVSHHVAINESLIPYFGRIACLLYNGATIQETTAAYMSCSVPIRKKQDLIAYQVLKEITKIQMELFDENNAW